MKFKSIYWLLIFLTIFSCKDQKKTSNGSTGLYDFPTTDQPKKVKLNLDEGYSINQFTGDSIQPIINSFGDTVKTGTPIPVQGKIIHPDSVLKPIPVPAGKPKAVPSHPNVHKVPENLTVIPIDHNALKTFTPGVDTASFVLVNSTGDTIPTGVPIPVKGKVVPYNRSQPIKALLPQTSEGHINIKYLDIDQGMNSSHISSVLEDTKGNIWFASRNAGVSMYDGTYFTYFTKKEGLIHNYVNSILEDKNGNIWIGTRGGVCMYDGTSFTCFTEKEGLSNNIVNSILEDKNGNIWIGTFGGGVCKYDGKTFTHFALGRVFNIAHSLLEDKKGNIWIGTELEGVYKYDGKSFTQFTEKDGLSHNWVRSLFEDKSGNIWLGTQGGGVNKYDWKSFTHFTEKEGLSSDLVNTIFEDKSGNIWFGTKTKGVSIYNGESFTHITEKEGLSHNDIWSILEDSSGKIWLGTWGKGVNIVDRESFKLFSKNEGLNTNVVTAITEDKSGNIWFGTWGEGVGMYNGNSIIHFTQSEGLNQPNVLTLLTDKKDNIWMATHKYDGKSFTQFIKKNGLSGNDVRILYEDSKGNIWMGTRFGGVSKYDGKSFTHFTEKEGLINNSVWSILEDSNGHIWLGTDNGVSKYDGESITHFTEKEGLSRNKIFSLIEDKKGNIWLGTNNGVNKFDGESFTYFSEKDGLSNNAVRSLLEDNNGNIWAGSTSGLTHFTFVNEREIIQTNSMTNTGLEAGYKITSYGFQDGIKGLMFNRGRYIDSKNRIWWGGESGLKMLNMNSFRLADASPKVHLKDILINEQFFDYNNLDHNDSLGFIYTQPNPFNNYPNSLELDYNKNHLTFQFSAIDWVAPHKIRYSYKMEGLNDVWGKVSEESKADFRNLPYGDYTFKVIAIGEDQTWSEPFEYGFVVLPPWWHTWWARSIYGLLFVLLIVTIIHIRTRILLVRQKQLETEVENRTKELRNTQAQLIHSEKMSSLGQLTAGIAHEINNPVSFTRTSSFALDQDLKDLTQLIVKYRSYILQYKQHAEEIEEFEKSIDYERLIEAINQEITDIKEGTKRTSEIVKALREFSHIDHEDMELANIHHGIDVTLNLLKSRFIGHIKLTKDFDQSVDLINCHIGQLNQVFLNILTNALDALNKEGEITIKTKNQGDNILISIEDNGEGIPKEIINKVFDPFFTTKKIGQGTGLGLSISHGIINNHGGTISVKSVLGEGTRFDIILPKS